MQRNADDGAISCTIVVSSEYVTMIINLMSCPLHRTDYWPTDSRFKRRN